MTFTDLPPNIAAWNIQRRDSGGYQCRVEFNDGAAPLETIGVTEADAYENALRQLAGWQPPREQDAKRISDAFRDVAQTLTALSSTTDASSPLGVYRALQNGKVEAVAVKTAYSATWGTQEEVVGVLYKRDPHILADYYDNRMRGIPWRGRPRAKGSHAERLLLRDAYRAFAYHHATLQRVGHLIDDISNDPDAGAVRDMLLWKTLVVQYLHAAVSLVLRAVEMWAEDTIEVQVGAGPMGTVQVMIADLGETWVEDRVNQILASQTNDARERIVTFWRKMISGLCTKDLVRINAKAAA